jgi:hypothetical protein
MRNKYGLQLQKTYFESSWENKSPVFFHYKLGIDLGTDRIENTASHSSIIAGVFVAAGTCLLNRFLATDIFCLHYSAFLLNAVRQFERL